MMSWSQILASFLVGAMRWAARGPLHGRPVFWLLHAHALGLALDLTEVY